MNLTTDQLSYILERKYTNIQIGNDVLIVCTVTPTETGEFIQSDDAHIIEWRLRNFPQPSEEEIDRIWQLVKDQYNSDPSRSDSEMSNFLRATNKTNKTNKPIIKLNTDL